MQEKSEYASALDSGFGVIPLCDSSHEGCDYLMQNMPSPQIDCCFQESHEGYNYGLSLLSEEPLCKFDFSPTPFLGALDSDEPHVVLLVA